MAITPNYSWPLPDDTSLVKLGAEAIRDLGNAIDTTVDGLPGAGLVHINTTSFSAVAEQILENVFTSEYQNYLMKVNISAVASGDVELRLFFRDETPADVTTNLNRERLTQFSTTLTGSSSGTNLFGASGSSLPTFSNYNVNIYNPNLARRTIYISDGGFVNNAGQPFQDRVFGYNNSNTVMTGIKIFPSASNFTGEVSIFGYKD